MHFTWRSATLTTGLLLGLALLAGCGEQTSPPRDAAGTTTGSAGGGGATSAASAGGTGGSDSGGAGAGGAASGGGSGTGSSGNGGTGGSGGGPVATFQNPLNRDQGSDPWLLYHEGNYYLSATTWSDVLTMRRSPTIEGLKTAPAVTVWTGDDPSRCCNMWAPEFHLLDGPNGKRWYFYYTAGPSGPNTDHQRMHVLESAGTDPMGPYTYKARLYVREADHWAIDGSVMQLDGRLYYLFSQWTTDQNIYIAAMSNPWTLTGQRVLLSSPTHAWERQAGNVNEGPVALQRGGKTFIVYSASACWGPDYKLGMLTYGGGDPLRTSSWIKSAEPVFQRSDEYFVYGPAHNGFFTSPDGTEHWIVYHANDSARGGCDTQRTTRAQKFTWNDDGTPNFGVPVATDVDIPVPSGE
ncbi:alpha-N-arabinofuranosidase [Sorangium cellulosum]|uniref:Alpha-N-arabinofuranosidase n=1 Tax=Sorangium cellulosum TaxID=56 RepID=A0A2L0EYE5_SORCE|nr:glycoside hydrolase family 43 protein [Sorangium cellulosum]AUX44322.1 alpha-N-arabinofuranosidase [Sorangium cellulosum]